MSKYIKDIDFSQYEEMDEEDVYLLYEAIEESDKEKDRKFQKKMRKEDGYYY